MKILTPWQFDMIPWYVFATYWLIAWLRVKRTKVQESISDRLATIIPMVIAFELLFSSQLRFGPLGRRFIPAEAWIAQAGIALTSLGVAIAIWARYCLGQYWSARVTLKEGHRIIRSGPYAFVRHPIYTGMLLAASGTALVIGEWRGVLGVVVMLVAHSHKALREQALLTSELGEEYASYRRATGFLFPRFWRAAAIDTHAERS
ncbi:MAG: isoprenylcysteine carboxylmethyltransferase family protein [Candidatus Sulfotelmatobacter sp.]|jgi:protein-S-isoprenylcysteine O-methyltransferase Ste14